MRAIAELMFVRRRRSARQIRFVAAFVATLLALGTLSVATGTPKAAAAGSPCGATINPIACENSQTTGVTPQSVWDITDSGDNDIQGYATDISVNAGSPINFKIDTTLTYTIDIYRLGWYGGNGARLWQSNLSHSAPVHQPACLTDPSTLLYDCGNWSVSATWNVPSNAVSGVYIARLSSPNNHGSQITFIVRNDASTSDIVFKTADETWQAYNMYGGSDFYQGTTNLTNSQARAFKISYNRPFVTRGANNGRSFLFSNEYPTIRFLERNGYDVSYITDIDADRYGSTLLTKHKVFMSVGHDEYWSQQERTNVEKARDAGVNLMFLSGNEVYWHTRWEPSIDSSNTPYRTEVSYKETWDDAKIDPTPEWTGTWRDPRFVTTPGGGNPENALTGTMYMSNDDDLAVTVTQAQGKTRLWRNSGLSSMSGASTALAPHTVGYESDEDIDNGFRPAGLVDLSTTVGSTPEELQDFGSTTLPGTTTHHLTLYRASSGALVFGAGTIQWGWGLDQDHDGVSPAPADPRMQQATMNMLADMRALPTTTMAGMVTPTTSTDKSAPTVTITSPANGNVANGTKVTVSGTATDVGGGQVAGVEVSLDAGATWHPATGTASWTYTGILHSSGANAIRARATDDSANTSAPVTRAVTATCPCSLFGNAVPAVPDSGDAGGVELGVRFSSDVDGQVTGVRFYKASANTGTHTGSLWSSSGSLLATGTFTGESSSGWQTLTFSSPVTITANSVYVASYYAPNGHQPGDPRFFYYNDYRASPLRAQTTSPDGSKINGVYNDGRGFPASTFRGANYYADVLFSPGSAPPTVVTKTPAAGATGVTTNVQPTAVFSKSINPSTLVFTLKAGSTTVSGSATYTDSTKTATFTPSAALANSTTYTASVMASDTSGTPMSGPVTWTFTTAAASAPPTVTAVAPAGGSSGVSVSVAPAAVFSKSINPSTLVFTLKAGSTSVAGSAAYTDSNKTATFTPSAALAFSTTYTASVMASDTSGTPMSAPFTWSFTTGSSSTPSSVTIFGNATPANANWNDPNPNELGVKFSSDVAGVATGVRFYKGPLNTGAHTGSLWTSTGTLLATATFAGESASGWQSVTFSSAVSITPGATYIASYHTNTGDYAVDLNGLSSGFDNAPLHVPANGGLYAYGSGGSAPTNSMSHNVWVDVSFQPNAPTPPSVTSVAPAGGSSGVSVSVAPAAVFSKSINPSTLVFTLKAGSTSVAGSAAYTDSNKTATFTPSAALAFSTTYTASVMASDTSGTPMSAPFTWSFTTGSSSTPSSVTIFGNATPANANWNDPNPNELGVKFSSDVAGVATGVRFYKGPLNTGAHTGSLWTSTGTLLATATFAGESASGWQSVTFSSAVSITPGATYIASYHTNTGDYAVDLNGLSSGFDNAPLHVPANGGLYAYGSGGSAPTNSMSHNVWVDVTFQPSG